MRSARRWQRSLLPSLNFGWHLGPRLIVLGLICAGHLAPQLGLSPASAQPAPGSTSVRSVLLVFSARSTQPSAGLIERAFRERIAGTVGSPIDLHVEHLALSGPGAPSYDERLADLLKEKYRSLALAAVVAVETPAIDFLLAHREELFPGVPLLYGEVGRQRDRRRQPPPDATGVTLVLEGQRTVEVALALHPDTERVVLLAGASAPDLALTEFARSLVAAAAPQMPVESLAGLPLDEQLQRIAHLPEHTVVIFVDYTGDTLGRAIIARDVLDLVSQASTAPMYGAAETYLGQGAVGGDMIRFGLVGERLAELLQRVLSGERANAIPPVETPASALMFDWRQLRRWQIAESRLPEGSLVLFRQPTLWSEYRWQILVILVLTIAQWLLITALLAERRRRRSAQKSVEVAELRYRTVADFTQDCEYWRRPDGSLEYISPSCRALTGFTPAEFLARPQLLEDMVVAEHRAGWQAHLRAKSAGGPAQRLEFQIRTKAGELRWIEHLCAPVVAADGAFLGTRGSDRDVTERKRAEEELRAAFAEIRELRDRFEAENVYLREDLGLEQGPEGIVGESDALHYVLSRARQVGATSSTVLLLGETGVGKELVARAIHNLSPRRERTLVRVNCAALPATLIESELFGHEKGAFTGALSQRKGRFETADGSTLFLDEIGEMPLDLQPKLLRVIQEGEFERVGGNRTLRVDVRLIAATNRVLEDEIRKGRFREDLWYRLNVFPITVPPLRKRREDIPQLARHFVDKICRKLGRAPLELSKATLADLAAYDWPGNVRELESVIERAVITSPGAALRLGEALRASPGRRGNGDDREPGAERVRHSRGGGAPAHRGDARAPPLAPRRGGRRRHGSRHQRQHPAQPDAQARNPAPGSLGWRETAPE